jgi:putative hydrolase of the HAD superfamily
MIKNIIFDLGGVIIDVVFERSTAAFEALNPALKDIIWRDTFQSDLFWDYEKGFISDAEFRARVIKTFRLPLLSDHDFDTAWNALLGDIPPARIEVLQQLATQYRVFLLSNTNAIHIRGVEQILQARTGIAQLPPLFERCYYSYDMGKRKPDPTIYQQVLEENGLNPAETLFLDDNLDNVHAAQGLGIATIHVPANTDEILTLPQRLPHFTT